MLCREQQHVLVIEPFNEAARGDHLSKFSMSRPCRAWFSEVALVL
jgi:hypothetical protein